MSEEKLEKIIDKISDNEELLMKRYELETGKSPITSRKTLRKDYLKWKEQIMSNKNIEHDCSGNWIQLTKRKRICKICGILEYSEKQNNKEEEVKVNE